MGVCLTCEHWQSTVRAAGHWGTCKHPHQGSFVDVGG